MFAGYKTFIGILISAVGSFMTASGYDAKIVEAGVGEALTLLDQAFTFGGLAFAFYGRMVAQTKAFSKEAQ